MKLLLDSHVLLWWSGLQPGRLSTIITRTIGEADPLFVSVATIWELEIKRSGGKIAFVVPNAIRKNGGARNVVKITMMIIATSRGLSNRTTSRTNTSKDFTTNFTTRSYTDTDR